MGPVCHLFCFFNRNQIKHLPKGLQIGTPAREVNPNPNPLIWPSRSFMVQPHTTSPPSLPTMLPHATPPSRPGQGPLSPSHLLCSSLSSAHPGSSPRYCSPPSQPNNTHPSRTCLLVTISSPRALLSMTAFPAKTAAPASDGPKPQRKLLFILQNSGLPDGPVWTQQSLFQKHQPHCTVLTWTPVSLPSGQRTPEGRAVSLPPQALAGEPCTV